RPPPCARCSWRIPPWPRRLAARRHDCPDPTPDISAGTEGLDFQDLCPGVHGDPRHALAVDGEFRLAEGRTPRRHEDDVVGYHVEQGEEVAGFARRDPGIDQVPDLPFII